MDFHHFFNLWDLYLRAQTRFFITVCFKTQAFDLYLLKNTFLSVLILSDPSLLNVYIFYRTRVEMQKILDLYSLLSNHRELLLRISLVSNQTHSR